MSPAPQSHYNVWFFQPDYGLIAKTCNTFRSYAGIGDGWDALYDIIKHFADNPDNISAYGGPGHWSDPDQVIHAYIHVHIHTYTYTHTHTHTHTHTGSGTR